MLTIILTVITEIVRKLWGAFLEKHWKIILVGILCFLAGIISTNLGRGNDSNYQDTAKRLGSNLAASEQQLTILHNQLENVSNQLSATVLGGKKLADANNQLIQRYNVLADAFRAGSKYSGSIDTDLSNIIKFTESIGKQLDVIQKGNGK